MLQSDHTENKKEQELQSVSLNQNPSAYKTTQIRNSHFNSIITASQQTILHVVAYWFRVKLWHYKNWLINAFCFMPFFVECKGFVIFLHLNVLQSCLCYSVYPDMLVHLDISVDSRLNACRLVCVY